MFYTIIVGEEVENNRRKPERREEFNANVPARYKTMKFNTMGTIGGDIYRK